MYKNGHLDLGKVEENHGLAQSGAKAYNYLFNKDTVIVMGRCTTICTCSQRRS